MALRGNLKDFSLPDVFQLVQLSRKTGVLRIHNGSDTGSIWFRGGDVFFAQSNWQSELLGQRLVSAEKITPSALARALELRGAEPPEGRRLGRILVDEGYITQKVLESFVQEQIQDTIFDLMRWDDGDFDFELLPVVEHEDIGLSVSIENIVMEGSRRLEEWSRIKKKVPSMEMVFKMATAPGEGTFEISLKPVEWSLLLLVDGTHSVAGLARETQRTDFEVARVIYGLFSAGLLEVASDDEVERLRTMRAERERIAAAQAAETRATVATPAVEPLPEAIPETPLEPPADLSPEMVAEAEPRQDVEPQLVSEPAHEEPAFLSAPATPSVDDMAVFEQMMSAVLSSGPADEAVPAEQPEPEPEIPSPPAAESDVVSPGALSLTELGQIPRPPISEDEFVLPTPEAAPEAEPPSTLPEESPAAQHSGFVPTGDLAADLLSLGLGELPSQPHSEPEPTFSPAPPIVMSDSDFVTPAPPDMASEVQPEPELGFQPEPEAVSGFEPEPEAVPDAGEGLEALLRSLDDAGEHRPAAAPASASAEPSQEPLAGGVISTDAYLADFEPEVGLNNGLGDEITALTGGDEGRTRPSVVVNPLPGTRSQDGPMLHRDDVVDRALVLKIIEGIEKL